MEIFTNFMIYGEAMIERAKEYYEIYAKGDKIGRFIVPSNEGLAIYLGIHVDTLYQWLKEEDKKDFSDIVRKVQSLRACMLQNEGLLGTWNSNITKLLLSKHGYSEKTESEVKQDISFNNSLKVEFINDNKDTTSI